MALGKNTERKKKKFEFYAFATVPRARLRWSFGVTSAVAGRNRAEPNPGGCPTSCGLFGRQPHHAAAGLPAARWSRMYGDVC